MKIPFLSYDKRTYLLFSATKIMRLATKLSLMYMFPGNLRFSYRTQQQPATQANVGNWAL